MAPQPLSQTLSLSFQYVQLFTATFREEVRETRDNMPRGLASLQVLLVALTCVCCGETARDSSSARYSRRAPALCDGRHVAARALRGGSADSAAEAQLPRGRGHGSGRGRGRGRGPRRPLAPRRPLDTATIGSLVRNLTSWQDAHASGAVFAAGNAVFVLLAFGRSALLLLWLAFIAAFVVPRRDDLLDLLHDKSGGQFDRVLDLAGTILDALKGVGSSLQQAFSGGRLPPL